MKDRNETPGGRPNAKPKRPYRKPHLEVYGELGQITGAAGSKGSVSDLGLLVKFTKTH